MTESFELQRFSYGIPPFDGRQQVTSTPALPPTLTSRPDRWFQIYLERPPQKMRLSINSMYLYQGVIIPILENRSIARTVRLVEVQRPSQISLFIFVTLIKSYRLIFQPDFWCIKTRFSRVKSPTHPSTDSSLFLVRLIRRVCG